jgi:hypothetical protein
MCYNLGDAEKKKKKKGPDFTQIQAKKKDQIPRMERDDLDPGFPLPADQSNQLQFPRSLMGKRNFSRSKS